MKNLKLNDIWFALVTIAIVILSYTQQQTIKKYNVVVKKSFELIQSQDSLLDSYEGMAQDYVDHLKECKK